MRVASKTLTVAAPSAERAHAPDAPRTRRRGAMLEQAILDAAWEEVAAAGYDQATMASVAARAGTNKAALYRRWPNRTELLTAAIDRRVVRLDCPPIDTGSLRNDVIAVLQAMHNRCRAVSIVPDPSRELAAYVRRQAATEGFDQMERVLRRAVDRGDVEGNVITPRITRLPVDVLYSELCLGSGTVAGRLVAEIVDDVFLPLTRQ